MNEFILKRRMLFLNRGIWGCVHIAFLLGFVLLNKPALSQPIVPEKERVALKAAIEDLIDTFGERYPGGREYLAKWQAIESAGRDEFAQLQRETLIANPLINSQPILFVVRRQYKSDHHNTATIFKTGEINTNSFEGGGAMKTVDFARGGGVKTLIETSEGLIRDPEIHFDGTNIHQIGKSTLHEGHGTLLADGRILYDRWESSRRAGEC